MLNTFSASCMLEVIAPVNLSLHVFKKLAIRVKLVLRSTV